MPHLIQVTSGSITGQYLQGPRTPQKVKRDGYGFTSDIKQAWPFSSHIAAAHKSRIVCRHMSWDPGILTIITPNP